MLYYYYYMYLTIEAGDLSIHPSVRPSIFIGRQQFWRAPKLCFGSQANFLIFHTITPLFKSFRIAMVTNAVPAGCSGAIKPKCAKSPRPRSNKHLYCNNSISAPWLAVSFKTNVTADKRHEEKVGGNRTGSAENARLPLVTNPVFPQSINNYAQRCILWTYSNCFL